MTRSAPQPGRRGKSESRRCLLWLKPATGKGSAVVQHSTLNDEPEGPDIPVL
jgi:hypothetical protein